MPKRGLSQVRHRLVTCMVLVLVTFAGGFAVNVAGAGPALAAACNGSSCNGRNPHDTGCDVGAYPLQSFSRAGVFVELRYSPSCNAAWARGVSYNEWRNCTGWTEQDILRIEGSTNRSSVAIEYESCLSYSPGSYFYTEMVGFNYWTRACTMLYRVWDPNLYYNGCTAWR